MAAKVLPEVAGRFNALLIPIVRFSAGVPPTNADVFGLYKFAKTIDENRGSTPERREKLETVLTLLTQNKKAAGNLNEIYEVLERARQARIHKYLEGYKIDASRPFHELQADAIKGLKALRRFFDRYDPLDAKTNDAIKTLSAEPALNDKWEVPQRRPRPGHQPEPWLKQARRELSAQKVPRKLQEDLLDLAGLFNPRPKR